MFRIVTTPPGPQANTLLLTSLFRFYTRKFSLFTCKNPSKFRKFSVFLGDVSTIVNESMLGTTYGRREKELETSYFYFLLWWYGRKED